MIRTIDLRGTRPNRTQLATLVPRAESDVAAAVDTVAALIEDVRDRGEAALLEQAERFDGVRPPGVRVDPARIQAAVGELPADVRAALEESIARVRQASAAQIPPRVLTELGAGARVTQRWQPVRQVGLYVPGGKAVYPSSVVMNTVPAQVAGVGTIAIASPPQREFGGGVHPVILGAAGLLGVDAVYAMGGAGAIGAFAFGVPSLGLEPVDIVTGPGNLYVAAAKRYVAGRTGIDSEAGPTEILVIADHSARPELVAADLISQAEHDELAAAVLVTSSPELADAVRAAVERLVPQTYHADRVRVSLGGAQSAIVLVDDLDTAALLSNVYGPEHLEIVTERPAELLEQIDNAGAVFLGEYSPVSLGDYLAGSNHVLPTGGQSRFSSGLGASTFLRPQQVIDYDRDALGEVAAGIRSLSDAEALPAHGDAVDARFS